MRPRQVSAVNGARRPARVGAATGGRPYQRAAWLLAPAAFVLACASAPRPQVLSQADQVAESPQAAAARAEAPQAFEHAESLRRRAEAAHEAGDPAAAAILSERAIAAYSHAFVLVRLRRAEERLAAARAELKTRETALAKLDEEHVALERDAEALELKLKVARDRVPRAPLGPADPRREEARLISARALVAEARLLCVSAWMLDAERPGLKDQVASVETLGQSLEAKTQGAAAAPVDAALTARAACLSQLTQVRRAATTGDPSSPAADRLLEALSARGGLEPRREDTGVTATLRAVFQGDKPTPAALEALEALAKIAKANPRFPLLVVVHDARADERAKDLARRLEAFGAPRVEARGVGDRLPLVPKGTPGAASKNVRVEVIFVSPLN
ncbi:MAG: hypothetical protein KIT72_14450 [Polyangiaceae bacterium]|nr:hypothetical protein [Polyangiaceae bacterium]MCW5791614.1 hypothetical protein [Polyangiaceae bacterium]